MTLEFSTDPRSGLRSSKGTYKERKRKSRNSDLDVEESGSGLFDCNYEDDISSSTVSGDMNEVILEAKEILQEWQKNQVPKQSWASRTAILQESWEESRSMLLNTMLKCYQVVPMLCHCCKGPALIRCNSCSPGKVLCGECDIQIHQHQPFHSREALLSDYAIPVQPLVSRKYDSDGHADWLTVAKGLPPAEIFCPKCDGKCCPLAILPETHLIVITLEGRFDLNNQSFKCESCSEVVTTSNPCVLIQLGFWPGSISNINYAFHQDLFQYWNTLQKLVPGISETSFIKSLEKFSCYKQRTGTINAVTFRKAFREWKYCQFGLDSLSQLDWMTCPACSEGQHSVHIDGNMKLYRFQQAGRRNTECYYKETFVASNAKVDEHIRKVYQGSTKKKDDTSSQCGDTNWRAATNTLRKKKNLCETGLEISGCRHALAQHAVNMMQGEVYGYGHYLQKTYYVDNTDFFWYDVCCKYWPWLKRHDPETASKMKPALSVMHSKAHSWHCQVIWGGRWQEGAAGTTGEEVEQINSHFSRLGSSTKHMLPEEQSANREA